MNVKYFRINSYLLNNSLESLSRLILGKDESISFDLCIKLTGLYDDLRLSLPKEDRKPFDKKLKPFRI